MTAGFESLEAVIADPVFPEVDVALRRGRHIAEQDRQWYTFLDEAGVFLETFYHRYHCDLVRVSDGYFFLLPSGELLGRGHVSSSAMLVGQTLALLSLDPSITESAGRIAVPLLLSTLQGIVGQDKLLSRLSGRRRSETGAEDEVRRVIRSAVGELKGLGFLDVEDGELLTRAPIMRFAEPVRGVGDGHARLEELIARGQLVPLEEDE